MCPDQTSRLVTMGTVGAPHGIRGWVRVNAATTVQESLSKHPVWILQLPSGGSFEYKLESSRIRNGKLVAKFESVDSCDDAQSIVGSLVLAERSSFRPLEKDAHYWCDLIGMEVRTAKGNDFGRVKDVMRLHANDVLVVADGRKETLIPFLKRYVLKVDEGKHILIVDWRADY